MLLHLFKSLEQFLHTDTGWLCCAAKTSSALTVDEDTRKMIITTVLRLIKSPNSSFTRTTMMKTPWESGVLILNSYTPFALNISAKKKTCIIITLQVNIHLSKCQSFQCKQASYYVNWTYYRLPYYRSINIVLYLPTKRDFNAHCISNLSKDFSAF